MIISSLDASIDYFTSYFIYLAPTLIFNLAGAFLFRVLWFPEGCVGPQENNTEAYSGRSFKRNIGTISQERLVVKKSKKPS